jgi:RNA polymerase sigma-70 factor (ECF subfamily)
VPSPGHVDSFVPPSAKGVAEVDAESVWRAKAGDREAFDAIFEAYQTAIFNYVYRMMGSADDAGDLTQDAFVKAWLNLTDERSRAHNDPELRVGAWLYRIATNVCLDELRHRKLVKWQPWDAFVSVFHPSQVAPDSPERDAVRGEDAEEVRLLLGQLRPRYRTVLVLREFADLSYDEIADALVTTRAAVKSLLLRAREEFRGLYLRAERRPGGLWREPGRRAAPPPARRAESVGIYYEGDRSLTRPWRAIVHRGGGHHYVGHFATQAEAVAARGRWLAERGWAS